MKLAVREANRGAVFQRDIESPGDFYGAEFPGPARLMNDIEGLNQSLPTWME